MLLVNVATKDTLSVSYIAIDWSVLNYGASIWASKINDTNLNYMKTQQNFAVRTTTGCAKMSDINDFLNEGEMLPFKAHSVAVRFLAGS